MPKPTIGVAVPTCNAKKHLSHCLLPFIESSLKPQVLVVDSSSEDGTVEEAQRLGAHTLTIPRRAFNHGSTREIARKSLGTDIVVMVTQDAYAEDSSVLEELATPIFQGKASISYARQTPHHGADFFEIFPREFNYPPTGHVRGIEDLKKYGVYTFFCSDSCAAYSNQALDEIGGFRSVLLGEDTVAAAMLLRKGHKIAYTADAIVRHSHRYSLSQEFQRSFDTGLARKDFQELLAAPDSDTCRGKLFVKQMLLSLWKENPRQIPYGLLQCLLKYTGYRLGSFSLKAPVWIKKLASSQKFYWESDDFLRRTDLT